MNYLNVSVLVSQSYNINEPVQILWLLVYAGDNTNILPHRIRPHVHDGSGEF